MHWQRDRRREMAQLFSPATAAPAHSRRRRRRRMAGQYLEADEKA